MNEIRKGRKKEAQSITKKTENHSNKSQQRYIELNSDSLCMSNFSFIFSVFFFHFDLFCMTMTQNIFHCKFHLINFSHDIMRKTWWHVFFIFKHSTDVIDNDFLMTFTGDSQKIFYYCNCKPLFFPSIEQLFSFFYDFLCLLHIFRWRLGI
jgi:hypothetical protein